MTYFLGCGLDHYAGRRRWSSYLHVISLGFGVADHVVGRATYVILTLLLLSLGLMLLLRLGVLLVGLLMMRMMLNSSGGGGSSSSRVHYM